MNKYRILTSRELADGAPVFEEVMAETYEVKSGYLTFYNGNPDLPDTAKVCTYDRKEWKKVNKVD
jgi:hypothetical protein